jgi:hypothetical protein
MKQLLILLAITAWISSCQRAGFTERPQYAGYPGTDTLITQSLFNDRAATIAEENIQKILDGSFTLPRTLRVALLRLESPQQKRYYWGDEQYLKTQQAYLELFSQNLKQAPRVSKLSVIPELLMAKTPSFTHIREAAVRRQADVVVVYFITNDVYAKYKFLNKPDIKAFATTQLILLDVRTGLIPLSTIVTKDYPSQQRKEKLDRAEARTRIQHEAVLLTIQEIGQQVTDFLKI